MVESGNPWQPNTAATENTPGVQAMVTIENTPGAQAMVATGNSGEANSH